MKRHSGSHFNLFLYRLLYLGWFIWIFSAMAAPLLAQIQPAGEEMICSIYLRSETDARVLEQNGCQILETHAATLPARCKSAVVQAATAGLQESLIRAPKDQLEWLAREHFRPHCVVTLTPEKLKLASSPSRLSVADAKALLVAADSDSDGLTDEEEAWWLCDPNNPDTDNDGVYDGDEVTQLRLGDPSAGPPFKFSDLTLANDQDQDSIPDLAERFAVGTNPNDESTDGDKYDDGQEYFGITKYPNWGFYPRSGDDIGAQMPGYVDDPGRSPLVSAYPEISVEIQQDSIHVETRIITFSGHTVGLGEAFGYSISNTVGESTTVGSSQSNTVNQWQEAGNRQAESEDRSSYQDNLSRSSSESFRANRLGTSLEVELGTSLETTAGTNESLHIAVPPSVEVGMSQSVTAGLHSTVKTGLEAESRAENRNSIELQKTSGDSIQRQRVNEITAKSGSGQETSMASSISQTVYHETTVTNSHEISTSEEWETATTVDSSHAADVTVTMKIKNAGTDRARNITNLRFNMKIGLNESDPLITYPALADPGITLPSLEPKQESTYLVGPIPLTLTQLRAIDEGKPIRIRVEDFDYGVDQAFYESAWGKCVLFQMDDGVDDGQEEVENYMLPTWGSETYQNVLARYFRVNEAANGDLASIRSPEYTLDHHRIASWSTHPVNSQSWWDVFLSNTSASLVSGNSEPFAVHIGDTLAITVNGTTEIATFSNITNGAATARQLANDLNSQISGLKAASLTIGGKRYLRLSSPVTAQQGDPTICVSGGTALSALSLDALTHDVYSSSRFIFEKAEPRGRVFLRYGKDTDGDGYSDREERKLRTDWNNINNHPDPKIVAGYSLDIQRWDVQDPDTQATVTLTMVVQNIGDYPATGLQALLVTGGSFDCHVIDNLCGGSARLEPSSTSMKIESDPITFIAKAKEASLHIPEVQVSYSCPGGEKKIMTSLPFSEDAIQFANFAKTPSRLAWHDAKSVAEEKGGRLATVDSADKNQKILLWCQNNPDVVNQDKVWLGATDEAQEDNWIWVTGDPMGYKNWWHNYGGGNYLTMYVGNPLAHPGTWDDEPGDGPLYGIIEYVNWLQPDMTEYWPQMRPAPVVRDVETSDQWRYSQSNQVSVPVTSDIATTVTPAKMFFEFASLDGHVVFEDSAVFDLSGGKTHALQTSFQPSSVLPDSEIGNTYKVVCLLTDSQGAIIDTMVKRSVIVSDGPTTPTATPTPTSTPIPTTPPPATDTPTPSPSATVPPTPSPTVVITSPTPSPTGLPILDSDGDGFSDDFETANSSNPHDPQSLPLRALDLDGDGQLTVKDAVIYYRNRIGQIPVIPKQAVGNRQ